MIDFAAVQGDNYEHTPWPKTYTSDNFTIFEGQAAEVQRQRGRCATEGC